MLQFGDMQRAHRHGERLDLPDVGDRQPVLFHVLDMLGPEIDKGHVLAGLDHMRAGIAADRPRAHHRNLLTARHQPSSTSLRPAIRPRPSLWGAPQSPGAILVRGGAEGEAMQGMVSANGYLCGDGGRDVWGGW